MYFFQEMATFAKEKHLKYEVQVGRTSITYEDFLITWDDKPIYYQQLCELCVKLRKNALFPKELI